MNNVSEWRCKSCDGLLDLSQAVGGVVECQFCHNVYSVPKEDASPEVISYLSMGEHDLDTAKFDDAYAAFEKAAQLSPSEPQAYFGMALSEFKVQQLKDSVNKKMQPICHDISDKSFSFNKNYRKAYSLATENQRSVYKSQCEDIDEIRREFYELQEGGMDYDCFICVKVSDDNGEYTRDSHYAASIYDHLKENGYKPFYSEREIKGRTGSSYEALILYALMKSECMLVVCSNEEYLNTPWVKNEYTRFLRLLNDEEKDSDAVTIAFTGKPIEKLSGKRAKIQGIDLGKPDAFSLIEKYVESHTPQARHRRDEERLNKERESEEIRRQIEEQKRIQAQLESRLNTITAAPKSKNAVPAMNIETLLIRARQSLEFKKWQDAEKYYNSALDLNPECGDAWFGLLLVSLKVENIEDFLHKGLGREHVSIWDFTYSVYCEKTMKYASGEIKNNVTKTLDRVREKIRLRDIISEKDNARRESYRKRDEEEKELNALKKQKSDAENERSRMTNDTWTDEKIKKSKRALIGAFIQLADAIVLAVGGLLCLINVMSVDIFLSVFVGIWVGISFIAVSIMISYDGFMGDNDYAFFGVIGILFFNVYGGIKMLIIFFRSPKTIKEETESRNKWFLNNYNEIENLARAINKQDEVVAEYINEIDEYTKEINRYELEFMNV